MAIRVALSDNESIFIVMVIMLADSGIVVAISFASCMKGQSNHSIFIVYTH